MVFSSLIFLFVFFPLILLGYYIVLKKHMHRNIFLFIVSLIFYSWGEPTYIILMLLSIWVNYKIGILIENHSAQRYEKVQKYILSVGIIFNLYLLFIFKYEGFVVDIITKLVPIRLASLNLPLPIGISFFTFQALSYLVDVYRKDTPAQQSVLNLGLYIAFFPQLVAGPIVRYNTIVEQIEERSTSLAQFNDGIKRFITGVGKKIIFANNFALVAEASFNSTELSITFAWLGAIAYTLQIYYDFSGYSDMAIGLGKMFGFEFLENFNYPYISKTITEFWRRWHISLGTWFKDYVYFPLGGSRVGKLRMIFNLFVVWSLTGIWHGAAWQFIAWGLLYFVILTFEKLTNLPKKLTNPILGFIYQIFTMLFVVLGWVLFAESNLSGAWHHIQCMFGVVEGISVMSNDTYRYLNIYYMYFVLGALLATPIFTTVLNKIKTVLSTGMNEIYQTVASLGYVTIFFIAVSYLVMGAHNPFIYFNF